VETGIPGAVILIGFTVLLLLIGFRRIRLESDPEVRILLAAVVAPLAGLLALYTATALTPTTPCGPYLWAAGGIISYWLVSRPVLRGQASARRPQRELQTPLVAAAG